MACWASSAASSCRPIEAAYQGWVNGAQAVNPRVQSRKIYLNSFDDASAGREAALALMSAGADMFHHNADAAALGLFQAAKERSGVYVFGSNADQSRLAPDRVIGSAIIDLPRAFLLVAREVKAGTYRPKVEAFGLESGVVRYQANPVLDSVVPAALKLPGRSRRRLHRRRQAVGGAASRLDAGVTVGSARLAEIVAYLDEYLRIRETPDERNAVNGLQVENGGSVDSIVAAVDASQATIDGVIATGKQPLLLVHHGLFWDGNVPVTGRRYRRLSGLIENDIALYSAHIPLDVHPEVGNNVVLAERLGVAVEGWFGDYGVARWGCGGIAPARWSTREALVGELNHALGTFAPGRASHRRRPREGHSGRTHHRQCRQHDRRGPGGGPRHLHHRRRAASHLLRCDRVGTQRDLRRSLRHRDPRRTGAGLAPRRALRPRLGVSRPPDRHVTTPALALTGIHKHFGSVHALRGADFTLHAG